MHFALHDPLGLAAVAVNGRAATSEPLAYRRNTGFGAGRHIINFRILDFNSESSLEKPSATFNRCDRNNAKPLANGAKREINTTTGSLEMLNDYEGENRHVQLLQTWPNSFALLP